MNKLLTIIIPTYNMEKYLHKCLDSLIIDEEGMKQLEVLVINDGSKDSSSQIAHEYQDKYPESFRVINKENGNYGSCINRGLKEATGKYVKVLDADDSFDNNGFKLYLKILGEIDVDLVVTNYQIVNEKGDEFKLIERSILKNKILSFSEVVDEFLNPQIQMHAVTYKTKNLRAINYYQTEGISYTDQEWMFMPMTTVKTLYYAPIVVYRYLVGRAGQTVEAEAHIRNIGHHIKSDLVMLNHFQFVDSADKAYTYLKKRCASCFYMLYYRYLIIRPNQLRIEDLIEIDKRIREVPAIYAETSQLKCKHVPFIDIWRKKGASIRIPLRIRILSFIFKTKVLLKKANT